MSKVSPSNIGRRFLEEIDRYLEINRHNLRCADIHNIYSQFFKDLKEFKGNSNGFTGLSEYLVFRFLYHVLGGRFDRRRVPNSSDLWEFVSQFGDLRIGQSVRVQIDGKRYYPDIVVYCSDKLIAVIQVKICLTHGLREIKKELEVLEKLRERHPEMRALLIIFMRLSKKGTILPALQGTKKSKKWFDFLILEQNEELFGRALQSSLELGRLAPLGQRAAA